MQNSILNNLLSSNNDNDSHYGIPKLAPKTDCVNFLNIKKQLLWFEKQKII